MKTIVAAVIVVIILVGGGFALAKHHKSNTPSSNTSNSQNSMHMNSTSSNQTSASNTSSNNSNMVTISGFAFNPGNVTVKKGTTVTWTNKDSVTHTVTENDGQSGPNSGDVNPGKTYSFTYNSVGTFKYHCSIHPEMLGSVTVTD